MIRFLTAGESHGRCLVGILEGLPAGLAISESDIERDLQRRQLGYGRGGRMQIETEHAQLLSGVRYGKTLGSPLALLIENRDFANWQDKMRTEETSNISEPLTAPRPGHADFAGAMKYGHTDLRNVIERASARETAMRTALAAICRNFFAEFGIHVASHVLEIGGEKAASDSTSFPAHEINQRADENPVRCLDDRAAQKMIVKIDDAKTRHDTVGGVFEVVVDHLPIGLGNYAHYDKRLDALLAMALMSIPAIKSVSIGDGDNAARQFGSAVHDRLAKNAQGNIIHATNHAGGIEGGISNGERVVIRAAMKPLATLKQPLETVDLATRETATALSERSDVCAVPAAAVVGEAMVLLALMNPFLEKFGGDSMSEIHKHFHS